MRATVEYNDGRTVDIDLGRDGICPLIRYQGQLFVLRQYVLGFIDNVSRGGENELLYHQTSVWNVELAEVETGSGDYH